MNNGQFISMFPDVKALDFDKNLLNQLGKAMEEFSRIPSRKRLPAGYTYFGQFVAHDLTHVRDSEVTSHGEPMPLNTIVQLSTPKLDLNPIYGDGFSDPRILVETQSGKMLYGYSKNGEVLNYGGDLPRHKNKKAVIADRRNDDNLIIAQLHLAFLKVHNKIIDQFTKDHNELSPLQKFEFAKLEVTKLYHKIILNDFLKQIITPLVYSQINSESLNSIWNVEQYEQLKMPVEFATAAFRFGHTMILPSYKLSSDQNSPAISLSQLISLTGKGKLSGNEMLPSVFEVDWSVFFSINGSTPQSALPISPISKLHINHLHAPIENGHIAIKNLLRANAMNCPAAQDIILYLSQTLLLDEIKPKLILISRLNNPDSDRRFLLDRELYDKLKLKTPLWYYLLVEAMIEQNAKLGHKGLGVLGSLIVAAVFEVVLKKSNIKINPKISNFYNDSAINYKWRNFENISELLSFSSS